MKFSKPLLVFLFVGIAVTSFFVSAFYTNTVKAQLPPAAPTGLTATAASQTQIDLSWTASSGATGYYVYRGGVYIGATLETSYSDTGLLCGTNYSYTVKAHDTEIVSADSNTVTPTTIVCTPAAPTNLTATPVSQTQVRLAWTDNSSNETSFEISKFPGDPGTFVTSTAANATSYDVTMFCDTQLTFYVKARNAGGDSSSINVVGSPLPCTPAAPTNLTATPVSQTQINLAWTDNSSNEANFIIYKLVNNQLVQVAAPAANTTSYSFTGSCGIAYSFQIVATNAGGTSAASNTASATTNTCVIVPSSPSISATPVPGSPKATTSGTGNASDYLVYYSLEGGTVAQYQLYAHTNSLSLTIPLSCPKKYRLIFFGYNVDTSLGGATYSSCSGSGTLGEVDSALGTTNAPNKKCAPKVEVPVTIDYCSQGFFGD